MTGSRPAYRLQFEWVHWWEDTQYDVMCGLASLAYATKGEFDKAIRALSYEPSDISKFYSAAGLETVSATPDGARLIELQRKRHAGVFQPARLLFSAQVNVAWGKFEDAEYALDQAEKCLGPEPGLQMSYCRHRACCLAGRGKGKEVENYIERMREIARELPKRSLVWEKHFASGRSYLYLQRFNDALAELIEAQRAVLHPIEKHSTAYWIARTHDDAGNRRDAIPYYQIVAASEIPSWMRREAVEALARGRSRHPS